MAEGASINGNLVRDIPAADTQGKSAVTKLKSVISGQDDSNS